LPIIKRCLEPLCKNWTQSPAVRCKRCELKRYKTRNADDFYQTRFWRKLASAAIKRDRACVVTSSLHRLTANHIIPRPPGAPPCELDTLANLMTMAGDVHSRYEADVRNNRDTELRRQVDAIRQRLIDERGLAPN
jgi:hypothetical protein